LQTWTSSHEQTSFDSSPLYADRTDPAESERRRTPGQGQGAAHPGAAHVARRVEGTTESPRSGGRPRAVGSWAASEAAAQPPRAHAAVAVRVFSRLCRAHGDGSGGHTGPSDSPAGLR